MLGQTEQCPLIKKPLGRLEQRVQVLPALYAYPCLQAHFPPINSSFVPQLEQLDPSEVALDPEGQTVQAPLTLPSPFKQAH